MPALTASELAAAHEVAAMAIQQHCSHSAELVESIARFIETWGDAPPNPRGRRQELANDVRVRFCPVAGPPTETVKGSAITDELIDAARTAFEEG